MTNRSKLAKLNKSVKDLNKSVDETIDKISTIQLECSELILKILEDENLLKNSVWEMKCVHDRVYLEFFGNASDESFAPIKKLFSDNFHSWLELEDGIRLRIDEEIISLHFDETKMALPFVNKHQLKIIGKNVSDKLHSLKREIDALEKLTHQFSLK